MGLGIGTGLDALSGFAQWSNSTIKNIEYKVSVPRVIAGSNNNNNVVWTFFQNKMVGERGQYKPTVIFGISKEALNNKFSVKFELTLGSKMVTDRRIPVKIVQFV